MTDMPASSSTDQRIAVVGLACRVPGAADRDAFWRLLRDGVEAVTEAPAGRGLGTGPHGGTRGGFLDAVDGFDPAFFGMSPREAAATDPQQRLVLELAWEALEDAGVRPERLRGSGTGVFVGSMADDYAKLQHALGDATPHTTTGLSRAVLANRLSYLLGLAGPSLTVDTAQSSSLVAVHLAVRSLLDGDSRLALAGGVHLNLLPEGFTAAELFGALSPSGRCRTFDADADGYVRGEGGGVVVLKRLADALADGDRVHGVILGSAQGSGTGPTLTAPHAEAQEAVIRSACADAGVAAQDVQYVELHGTGTPVGDPVEAAALGAALGSARPADAGPLAVGSVKTNIGHLEGAAGVVGLVKTLLCLRHRQLVPSLNFRRPAPGIPLGELGLTVQTSTAPWPRPDRPLVAGVSSFGMGGTNCHVVVGEGPVDERRAGEGEGAGARVLPVLVSARDEDALRAQATRLHAHLDTADPRPGTLDLAASLATARSAFEHRAVLLADDHATLTAGLAALAQGREAPGLLRAVTRPNATGTTDEPGFLFSGQGSQRPGTGRELYAAFPVFARALDTVCAALDAHLERPLRDLLFAEPESAEAELLHRTEYAQPALFAIHTAQFRLLDHWGVRPRVLLGHSVGELSAAHCAGVLTLPDAALLVAGRGRLMQSMPDDGTMTAVQATEEEVTAQLRDGVAVAALNGPRETVISGDADAVRAVAEHFRAQGRKTTGLRVSHAFHSAHMDGMLDAFRRLAEGIVHRAPELPLISNVTGELLAPGEPAADAGYWVRHVRGTVRFHAGLRALRRLTPSTLELGPGATLTTLARHPDGVQAPTLRRGQPEARSLLTALGTLHAHGHPVDWDTFFADLGARRVDLPTYPFQRTRHWLRLREATAPAADATPDADAVEDVDAATESGASPGPVPESGPSAAADARVPDRPEARQHPEDTLALVRTHAAAVLGYATADEVTADRTFRDLGLDSYGSVELRDRLARATATDLPSTVLFDHPTPSALADHLHSFLTGADEPTGVLATSRRPAHPDGDGREDDPVVIVGMGCRYPGAVSSPEELWRLVHEERDAIGPFPTDRGWNLDALHDEDPDRPGTTYARDGGFLTGADGFDAEFFGISPREALAMDPQQRVLLETAWEAFEHAGLDVTALHSSRTGVFVGTTALDYGPRMHEAADGLDGYVLTGTTPSVASGRISYTFGFEGPAVTVDTACSSSLVALHLAVQSLRSGECDLALAGGVTVLSTPGMFVEFSRQRGLAPDGRCKPFAAGADGTGWAEGAGLLVVERLSDARRNGHTVLAVVRGTATNQDGASNGLTAPNGPSQQRVITTALANAGLGAGDVDAVEAHGTGTTLGDPIEAHALQAAYGTGRDASQPLWLGSVKSNIGHTQAAAGVAGVIKMVQAMRHGRLPKSLHIDQPTPHVPWDTGALRLLTDAQAWPDAGRPRRAAVSSFGISGTNAHVILEQGDRLPDDTTATDEPEPAEPVYLPLSGRSRTVLRDQARRLHAHWQQHPGLSPSAVGRSLRARARFTERAAVTGTGREELLAGLEALAEGVPHPTVIEGTATDGKIVFVYPGQGSQWPGMATGLLDTHPAFTTAIDACAEALAPHTDWNLRHVLTSQDPELLQRTDIVQPALWAMMIALTRTWQHHGIHPHAVIGHSQGEITAAHIAGALTLHDSARIIALRSHTLHHHAPPGGMLSLNLNPNDTQHLIHPYDDLHIAAHNSPTTTIIAGNPHQLDTLQHHCTQHDIRHHRIPVTYASHTPHITTLRNQLLQQLAPINPTPPTIPFHSTLTTQPIDTTTPLNPDYWYQNLRHPVRFHTTLTNLTTTGHTHYLEPSPHPTLTTHITQTHPHTTTHHTLKRHQPTTTQLTHALAHTHTHGLTPTHEPSPKTPHHPPLPTYPFQHQRFWISPTRTASAGGRDHSFLDAAVPLADAGGVLLTGSFGLSTHPWLADHAVVGTVLLPGASMVEMALHAAQQVGCSQVDEITLSEPLPVPSSGSVQVQVQIAAPDESGRRTFTLHSRSEGGTDLPWTRHAEGVLSTEAGAAPAAPVHRPESADPVDVGAGYARLDGRGYGYGPAFRGLRGLWRHGEVVHADVALPEELHEEAARFSLHPALLDAVLHAALLAGEGEGEPGRTLLPFAWSGVRLHAVGATSLRIRVAPVGEDAVALEMTDPAGGPVASVERLDLRPAAVERLRELQAPQGGGLYGVEWAGLTAPQDTGPGRWAVLGRTTWRPRPGCPAFAELSALGGADSEPEAVFALLDADATADPSSDAAAPEAVHAACEATLRLLRDWIAEESSEGVRLVLTTRRSTPDALRAPLHALARTTAAENPNHPITLLTLDDTATPQHIAAALATGEPELGLDGGRITAPRLTPLAVSDHAAPEWDPDGTVLVTGGTGALGRLVATHLARRHGMRHLLLASRSGPGAEGAAELRDELAALGATATIAACDIADPAAVDRLLASVPGDRPLTAVVHTAGVLDDALTANLTDRQLHTVLTPKVDAAHHLLRAARHHPLKALVLFSSVTATLPSPGQANYAAANAYLDALAMSDGPSTATIAWGLWDQPTGMTTHMSRADVARMARSGVSALETEDGLALFDRAISHGPGHTVAARLNPGAFRNASAPEDVPAVLRRLVRVPPRRAAGGLQPTSPGGSFAERLAGLSPEERKKEALRLVRTHAATVLGHASPEQVDTQQAFKELGFDSLTAVELRNRLSEAVGRRLPTTLVFDHPTPTAVAAFLIDEQTVVKPAVGRRRGAEDADDPIVVVGMACRYPGDVTSPDELWDLVAQGRDAITPFPTNRGWDLTTLHHPDPDHPGTTYTRHGGFLHTAGHFDADLFGISPREALAMDPQQRILLETAWEALENAGLDPTTQRGTRTGVFTGLMYHDYGNDADADAEGIAGHVLTGTQASVASGRVSYTFGFEGPAVTVDTACSSSLVAVHLAAQSLRSGESDLALAGGVTIMASPGTFIEFSRQRGLAPDGRCKPFAAAADGTGWAEGAGLLLLERLSDARRNHHTVLAVVRGTATNQDGASNGLTAPNGPSQQRVITTALTNAGLTTDDVDAVEAHGTGTTLGDPIEAQALQATYGTDRNTDQPLWLGSIKSNIGHTQAAAGAAGLIKMIQAMRHGQLPQTLHIDQPTPHIDWDSSAVSLLTETIDWPDTGRPRRAAVSSFGISGTNAHVILEQGDTTPEAPTPESNEPLMVPLSAHSSKALSSHARRLHSHLGKHPEMQPAQIGDQLHRRSLFDHRAAVVCSDRDELLSGLEALAEGVPHPTVIEGTATDGKIVFVYPGQGSQWPGMATGLLDTHPAFTTAIDACAEALAPHTDWNLRHVLTSQDPELLQRTDIVQPALWAMMIALTRTWQHHGIHPHAVIGHSQGEITAAHIAGALTLHDSARIIALRSHTLHHHAPPGGMLSLNLNPNDTQHLIHPYDDLHIAAHNSPTTTIIAGNPHQLDTLQHHCTQHDIRHHRIPVTYASHTPHITTLRNQLLQQLAPINPTPPTIPFHSTLTTQPIDTTTPLNPDYWYQNLRHPVRFHTTLTNLTTTGHTHYLEPSPHPTLTTHITQTHPHTTTHHTLKRHQPTTTQLTHALAHTHTHGLTPTHPNTTNHHNTPPTPLPTYPFQHRNYWLKPARRAVRGATVEDVLSRWRYTVGWQEHPDGEARSGESVPESVPEPLSSGTWLVVRRDAQPPGALLDALAARGWTGVPLDAVESLPGALDEHPDAVGVLSLLSDVRDTLALVKAHAEGPRPVPLWHVTRGAVQATAADAPPSPEEAQIWGLGRVAALEHPTRWGGLVDLPAQPQPQHYALLARHLAPTHTGYEDQLAVRDDAVHVPRLRRAPRPAGVREAWRPRGVTLVTGATGALGPHIARWLVRAGAEHLVLTSRRGAAAEGVPELAEELEAEGVRVTVAACDVADREAVAQLVKRLDSEGHKVGSVVHAAALMQLNSLDGLTLEEFEAVVEAKVAGARHLDELLAHHPVDAFVLFSSIAGVWGSGDHGAYAAANAYLDAFAAGRRARGLPATSVAWGVWGSDRLPDAVDPDFLRRQGLPLIDPDTAFAGLHQALDHDETFVAVADVDWARFLPVFASARPRPLLNAIPEVAELLDPDGGMAEDGADDGEPSAAARLAGLPAAEREAEVLRLVLDCLAAVLGRDSGGSDIDPKAAFKQLGVDSLLAVELRNRLGHLTGLQLPATLVFEHPHPLAVAGFLGGELAGSASDDGQDEQPGSVDDELSRLEARLAGGSVAPAERAGVAERLRALLNAFQDDGVHGGARPATVPSDDDELDDDAIAAISDDEMFDLIDKELGDV
ncbi:type I polyketide synthase [Streptomyces sp. WMMC1477]|uniref:type I polyketide synthase n=1 Tax=Streptomyces sp. WMMC1477 TaxID=3015155 RepID=UPI0022B717BF|nr:type I polyketide synthase [Streptomyces sp. WMMC1477]MCZ7432820.1 SDR family NAD(P)-dependent oxidoreductase [Streptomyces sp. WMMC1477]